MMNRIVALLPVALFLAVISLAQPAHAQWVKGQPYYDSHNSAPTLVGGTTYSSSPVGSISLTSSPQGYPNTATGSFSGIINVDYIWTGGSVPTAGFSGTDGFAVSGSCTQNSPPRISE